MSGPLLFSKEAPFGGIGILKAKFLEVGVYFLKLDAEAMKNVRGT